MDNGVEKELKRIGDGIEKLIKASKKKTVVSKKESDRNPDGTVTRRLRES